MKTLMLFPILFLIGCASGEIESDNFADRIESMPVGTSYERMTSIFGRPNSVGGPKDSSLSFYEYQRGKYTCYAPFDKGVSIERPKCLANRQEVAEEQARESRRRNANFFQGVGSALQNTSTSSKETNCYTEKDFNGNYRTKCR